MKKLLLLLLIVPMVSFGQMDYYVSAKGGLNVREAPEANAKKVSTLSYGTFVSIESRTGIKLTINDTDKETGITKVVEGEWVEVIFGTNFKGYVFDGFLRKNSSSFLTRNDGTAWTDGTKSIIFRSLSSIEYRESKEPVRGYIFDGFLKKSIDNIKFYNDQGYFIIIDSIVNTKNIYTISSKSAIDVRDSPNSSGNVVGKLMSGMAVNVLSETENMLTINDVDNQVGGSREMPGRWVEIETYSPLSGHRQETFPDNNGSWFYVDKAEASRIVKDPGKFDCHMCGYQAIKENTLNKLLFVREEMGDYGDGEYLKHTFSIEKKEIVEIKDYYDYNDPVSSKRIWIPINSNSVDIDRIKNRNKPKEYSQAELDSISAREIELRALQEEEMTMDDTQYYFLNDARLIEDPKSSKDFYNNGLVKFFNPNLQNHMEAIDDLNTAIEINVVQDEEELWVGPAYFYMGIAKGRLSFNGVRDDWKMAASLGFYHAKKAIRENGYASLLLIGEIKDNDINKFPGTDSYTLSNEGESKIYNYDSYQITTTDLRYVTGFEEIKGRNQDNLGDQIKIFYKDGKSIELEIGNNEEILFRGLVHDYMIIIDGGMSTPEVNPFRIFDLKNRKYVFYGNTYNDYKIVNSKIEFYEIAVSSSGKFTKPKCSSELDELEKQYPGSIGYIEKLIYDIVTQKLERTGVYECAYFQ